jgi:hypothetical protein
MALINNQPSLDALGGTSPQYRYPDSLGKPPFEKWILFQVKNANHINRTGPVAVEADVDKTIASVALYLTPEALSSTLTANYDSSGYGIVGGAAMDASMQAGVEAMKVLGGTQSLTEGLKNLKNVVNVKTAEAAGTAVGAKLVSTLAEDVGLDAATSNKLAGTFGSKTLNPRVDLFYQNTEYRQHDMQFTLIPRNKAEAETIDNILNVFNEAMLADYGGNFLESGTTNFIGYPYEFEIMMFTQGNLSKHHINTIDRSVLKSVSINHASGTRVAFVDSRGEAEYYPASTTLRLTFQETRIQGRNNTNGWQRGRGRGLTASVGIESITFELLDGTVIGEG